MFSLKFYERIEDDKWRKVGSLQHPSNVCAEVLDNASKALSKLKDSARVGRVVVERMPEPGAEFALLAPKKKEKK